VPVNKPFPDMSVGEAKEILEAVFNVADRISTLHLTGGGEPFLHPKLDELIEMSMTYSDRFDRLMLFTNSTISISDQVKDTLKRFHNKIVVQMSRYKFSIESENDVFEALKSSGVGIKEEKYYGENQSFGGWIDFGGWESHGRTSDELGIVFNECSVTRVLQGNWRTRDGRVHWCTRSQRGMELGYIPDVPDDYVDLLDRSISDDQKRDKFLRIAAKKYISACDYCSGDAGTSDILKRYPAAEQI
jgi:hypothetical protein